MKIKMAAVYQKLAICAVTLVALAACSSAYYATWEKLGKHKRDLLQDNVVAAKNEQEEAQTEFKDALTRLKELRQFDGGELEKAYRTVSADYESCAKSAEDVRDRIKKVDSIAQDLFAEWEAELVEINNPAFKKDSVKKLEDTRKRYALLHQTMLSSEKRLEPVLAKFRDYVLYLKHNLNAKAVGSLSTEVISIEKEVDRLIVEMDKSIAQADAFVAAM